MFLVTGLAASQIKWCWVLFLVLWPAPTIGKLALLHLPLLSHFSTTTLHLQSLILLFQRMHGSFFDVNSIRCNLSRWWWKCNITLPREDLIFSALGWCVQLINIQATFVFLGVVNRWLWALQHSISPYINHMLEYVLDNSHILFTIAQNRKQLSEENKQ